MELLDEIMNGSLHGGVLGLTRQPDETADVAGLMTELDEDALIIVCPRLEDVGQVGSIIRNAAALGAKAVVFGREGASPFERGSVRASSGAIFRLPLRVADGGQILRCLKTAGFQLIGGTEGEKCVSLSRLELEPGRHALVVGSHVTGLGSFWKAACDTLVKVPSESNDETLDSAAASAVLLWEIARCRREQAENEG
jgi:tRNA G18 (ribose-2'-O)-methylase SpoU